MSKRKSGVVGIISGLNKKSSYSSVPSGLSHHNNPLFNAQHSKKNDLASSVPKNLKFPSPSSPIRKKTFFPPPGSPVTRESKAIAGSPIRQPRSPLSPITNSPTGFQTPMKPAPPPRNKDTPRPDFNFHQNLNNTLRSGPPIPQRVRAPTRCASPVRKVRAASCYSPSPKRSGSPMRLPTRPRKRTKPQIPTSLPPPPLIPSEKLPLPSLITPLTQQTTSLSNPSVNGKDNTIPKIKRCESTIEDLVDRIKKKSTRQMDLAVYQSIQYFTCNPLHHRSSKILECLLQFNKKQLVQHFIANLSNSRGVEDRRNAADTLSSLVIYAPDSLKKEHQLLLDTLASSENIPILVQCIQDDDIAICSYMTGVLAAINIEPSHYIPSSNNELSKDSSRPINYSFQGIPKIIRMLEERNPESREAALSAIICMGPIANNAVEDLADFLLKEKLPQLRIMACKALYEIGTPYSLKAVQSIQEIVRKDKEESVKVVAQEVLDHLKTSFISHSEEYQDNHLKKPSLFIDEDIVKQAIVECQSALKSSSITASDIKNYFLHCYPNISKDHPRWKQQLRTILQEMVLKGAVHKSPATYNLSKN